MEKFVLKFMRDESGVTAVEYALLAAAAAGVFAVAGSNFYTKIQTALEGITLDSSSGDSGS